MNEYLPKGIRKLVVEKCKENDLNPGLPLMLCTYLSSIILMYAFGMTLIITIITLVYPCYKSILAIESLDEND